MSNSVKQGSRRAVKKAAAGHKPKGSLAKKALRAPKTTGKTKHQHKPQKIVKAKLKPKRRAKPKIPRKAKPNLPIKKRKEAKGWKKTLAKRPHKKHIVVQAAQPQVKRELSKEMQSLLAQAQARQWLVELGGENTLEVIKNLCMVPSDEELAKKLKVKVSDVRASLNKLHSEGLVTYMRDKNSETSWYSYSWAINEEKIKKWLAEKQARVEAFKPTSGVDLYFCKYCGLESALRFEIASDYSFKCPACNASLDLLDENKFEQIKKAMEDKSR